MEKFKKRVLKSRGLMKPATNGQHKNDNRDDGTERKVFAFGGQSNSTSPKTDTSNQRTAASLDNRSASSKASLTDNNSSKVQPLKEIRRAPLTLATNNGVNSNNNVVTEGGIMANLSDQVMCFCGKHVSLIEPNK